MKWWAWDNWCSSYIIRIKSVTGSMQRYPMDTRSFSLSTSIQNIAIPISIIFIFRSFHLISSIHASETEAVNVMISVQVVVNFNMNSFTTINWNAKLVDECWFRTSITDSKTKSVNIIRSSSSFDFSLRQWNHLLKSVDIDHAEY